MAAPDGWKRKEFRNGGELFAFVNGGLIPHLQKLKDQPNATSRQKVISQIMSGVERTRIDTEFNLFEVLDKVHAISQANIDSTHVFPISQAYEGLLLKLGEKNNDGGQFFTPRVVDRAMARVVKPRLGQTVYDPGCGTAGMVLDEGVLFRTNETAFVQTKRKLLDDCNLFCIVSLPGGVFSAVGAGVKTNLLFFIKGESTKTIWYYDLSDVKVTKKTPLTMDHFADFFARLDERSDSDRSWTINIVERRAAAKREADPIRAQAAKPAGQAARLWGQFKELARVQPPDKTRLIALKEEAAALEAEARDLSSKADAIESAVYDLKAVNPKAKSEGDQRTPAELIEIIEAKGREVAAALAELKGEAGLGVPEDAP